MSNPAEEPVEGADDTDPDNPEPPYFPMPDPDAGSEDTHPDEDYEAEGDGEEFKQMPDAGDGGAQ